MNGLPMNISKLAARYEPILYDGFWLCPVRVKNYEEFAICRPALEVMHQSLNIKYMRMPLLSALYAMDYEAVVQHQQPTGLFSRAILALALSMRLGEGQEMDERLKRFELVAERTEPGKLIKLRFTADDGQQKEILPAQYAHLRRIIAAQNGVPVESDDANPDIVKAKKMAMQGGVSLNYSVDDLISAVASLSGIEEREIDEWAILKLQKRTETYKRILDYLVCGFGEMSGTTWKSGNPVPHPFFSRDSSGAEPNLLSPNAATQKTAEQAQKFFPEPTIKP